MKWFILVQYTVLTLSTQLWSLLYYCIAQAAFILTIGLLHKLGGDEIHDRHFKVFRACLSMNYFTLDIQGGNSLIL